MHLRRLAALLFAGLLLLAPAGALAQDDTPRADPDAPIGTREAPAGERLDLAAIALDAEDVGDQYALSNESYISADQIARAQRSATRAEIAATGIRWFYESDYESTDGSTRLRVYVEEYGSAAGARKGFDLFENEDRMADPSVKSEDKPGLDVGEAPSEVTVATVEGTNGSSASSTVDATFRVDRLLLGVALDTSATTPPSEDDLVAYADRLAERAQTVLDGDDLPGIDYALPGRLLGFGDRPDVNEGYASFTETYGAAVPTEVGAAYVAGYDRTIALGDPSADVPLPVVTLAVAAFKDEATPLAIFSNATTVMPAYTGLERELLDPIPGTSASVAFSFVNAYDTSAKDPDSFRLWLLIGDDILTIEVQGAASVDAAQQAALALATQEIACYDRNDGCGTAQLPAGFGAPKG